jgi:tight adherence protein B
MSDSTDILLLASVIALSAALLAWFVIDVGSTAMAQYRTSFTERAGFQAKEFFLFIDPQKLFAANLATMLLASLALWMLTGSALLALPVFFGMAFLPRMLYRWMRERRLRKFDEQLPDALMMLAGGMRAGLGLASTIQQLVAEAQPPLGQEFAVVLREQRMGVTLEQSLTNLSRRVPTQSTVLIVSAMRIAAETGGGLAETLERSALMIRSRLQMEGKIGALTAQGKLQAWVVGLLPLVLMAILDRMEPEAMSHLWHSRLGWGVLVVIAFLEIMGIYVIRRIVAIDV